MDNHHVTSSRAAFSHNSISVNLGVFSEISSL